MVLVMNLHVPLGAVHHLPHRVLRMPLRQLVPVDEPVGRIHVHLREQQQQPVRQIELILVVDVVLRVHEILPLRLRLRRRRMLVSAAAAAGAAGGLEPVVLEVPALPLLVLAAALDVGDEGVEGGGIVVGPAALVEGEGGSELEAAVAAVGGLLVGGVGDEEEEEDGDGYVHGGRNEAAAHLTGGGDRRRIGGEVPEKAEVEGGLNGPGLGWWAFFVFWGVWRPVI